MSAARGLIDLSIVIPAFNEAARLPRTLANLIAFLESQPLRWEVIVSDDGSTDETIASIAELSKGRTIRTLRSEMNRGKGHAVRAGMLAARGEIRVMFDADNSMPARELTRLLAPIAQGEAPIAIGSRYLNGRHSQGQPLWRRGWSRLCNAANQRFLTPGIVDTHCGYKAFTARAAEEIFGRVTIDGWSFDLEVLAIAQRSNYRIAEISIDWKDDKSSRVHPLRDFSRVLSEAARIRCNLTHGRYDLPPQSQRSARSGR